MPDRVKGFASRDCWVGGLPQVIYVLVNSFQVDEPGRALFTPKHEKGYFKMLLAFRSVRLSWFKGQ